MLPLHPPLRGIAILAALGLQACVSDATPTPGSLAASAGQVPPAADFVARSRPEKLDYIPVGTASPDRPVQARSAAEVAAAEAELEALRQRNEAQGAATRRAGGTAPARTNSPAKPATPVRP